MSDNIPKNWNEEKFSEVVDIEMGNSPNSKYYNEDNNGKPFLQGNNEFGRRYPKPDRFCSVDKKIAEENDIMISIRAPVGDTNIADEDYVIGRGLAAITSDDLNNEFLYWLLSNSQNYLERISVGSTFDAITSREFNYLDVLIPPLSEQRRIASVLYSVDEQLEVLHERKDKLSTLKHGLMQDLLTGEKRVSLEVDVREDISTDMKKSKKESIDRDKCMKRIGNYFELINGQKPNLSENGEHKYLNVSTLKGEEVSYTDDEDVPFSTVRDTLMIVDGSRSGKVYRGEEGAISSTMSALRPSDNICPEYLYQVVSNQYKLINAATIGSSIPHADKTLVKSLELFIPPLWEQERIASILYTVDKMILNTDNQIEKLECLKRGLMQDLLSGDVRTPEELQLHKNIG